MYILDFLARVHLGFLLGGGGTFYYIVSCRYQERMNEQKKERAKDEFEVSFVVWCLHVPELNFSLMV